MTRIIDTPKALLVEVPEGTYDFEVFKKDIPELRLEARRLVLSIYLENISYGQPILASEMSEEDILKVVEKVIIRSEVPQRVAGFYDHHAFVNYESKDQYNDHFNAPVLSMASLLRSNNLKPETTVVITKL